MNKKLIIAKDQMAVIANTKNKFYISARVQVNLNITR